MADPARNIMQQDLLNPGKDYASTLMQGDSPLSPEIRAESESPVIKKTNLGLSNVSPSYRSDGFINWRVWDDWMEKH